MKFFPVSSLLLIFILSINLRGFDSNNKCQKLVTDVKQNQNDLCSGTSDYNILVGCKIEKVNHSLSFNSLRKSYNDLITKNKKSKENGNYRLKETYFRNWNGNEWHLHLKYGYEYDSNNNLIEEFSNRYTEEDNPEYSRKSYSYDDRNLLLEYNQRMWEATDCYSNLNRYFTYNENMNEVEQILEDLTGHGKTRKLTTYNQEGLKDSFITQTEYSGYYWYNDSKETYTYSEDDTLVTSLYYLWNFETEDWQLSRMKESFYNFEGQLYKELSYRLKDDENWKLNYKKEWLYNSNNQLIELSSYEKLDDGLWELLEQNLIEYDGMNLIKKEFISYDESSMNSDRKILYEYNDHNSLIKEMFLLRSNNSNNWEYSLKYIYAYDENQNKIYSHYLSWQDNSWCDLWEKNFTYETIAAIDEEIVEPQLDLLQNYPNPFNPETTIKYSIQQEQAVSITIFNSQGQLIKKLVNARLKAGSYNVKFDGTNLNSGVYYCLMKIGNKTLTKKMMLIK